jgi:hypothetical protein
MLGTSSLHRVVVCKGRSSGHPPVSEARNLAFLSQQTVCKIVRKHLQLRCYKIKILQQLKPDATLCAEMMQKVSIEDNFPSSIVFSNETTFHLSGTVNCKKVYGPFFFMEQTITGTAYIDMTELWLVPQLKTMVTHFSFNKMVHHPIFITISERLFVREIDWLTNNVVS